MSLSAARKTPSWLTWPIGLISVLLLALNTVFWSTPIFALSLLKVLPVPALRRTLDRPLNALARAWVACNSAAIGLMPHSNWDVQGVDGLSTQDWYLVNCNHQSWVDIFVLQRVLGARIPFLKFFLKQELIYVPVIGLAWWALDFPFLKRHDKAALRKRPELREEDYETAKTACRKFARTPTGVMSFAEGTRFTPAKHDRQDSPYRHLLKPKSGSLALAIATMGGQFRALLDVTIVYRDGPPSFWQFVCGQAGPVVVRVHQREIPADIIAGDYMGSSPFRRRFQQWLNDQWTEKDAEIDQILGGR